MTNYNQGCISNSSRNNLAAAIAAVTFKVLIGVIELNLSVLIGFEAKSAKFECCFEIYVTHDSFYNFSFGLHDIIIVIERHI